MRPQQYRTAAAELRALADRLEQRAEANTAQQRRSRTLAVHAVAHAARRLFVTHSGVACANAKLITTQTQSSKP